MKRFLTIFCALCISGATLFAQKEPEINVEGGIKADVVFLNFLTKAAPTSVSTQNPGGSLGGFATVNFNDWIGLQPEFNLNYKRTSFGWNDNSGLMQSMGIEIPIYVMFDIDVFKTHRINLGIGPYTEFTYVARWETGGRKVDLLEIKEDGNPMIQDTQSGFAFFAGYEFGNGIGINISYRLCCYNILQPNSSQGVSLYPQTASVGISYKFRK